MKEMKLGNLAKALALAMLAPATVNALSIGDIQLHSALNQRLDAEIRLRVDAGEDPRDIAVRIAAPEKFDRAGIPWSYFLSKIKFETVVKSESTVVIKLSSVDALTEPFVDVLLEVLGAQGSQFKEFPLLLDPPANYQSPNTAIADNREYRSSAISEDDVTPRKSQYAAASTSKHIQHSQHSSPPPVSPSNNTTPTAIAGEVGPTKATDNLWQIANRLASERGVSVKQMMNALYRANPDAFVGNNINVLKLGVKLSIPVIEGSIKPHTNVADANAVSSKQTAQNGKPLEVLSPVDVAGNDKDATANQGKPTPGGAVANSQVDGNDAKGAELQSRIEKLEQQLGLMQQLLALKDQQLSEIQNAEKNAHQPSPANPIANAPNPTASTPTILAVPAVPQAPVPSKPEQIVKSEPVPTPDAPQQPVLKLPPAPQTPALPAESQDFFGSDSYYQALSGIGVALFSVLGVLFWRKRNIDLQTSRESMFASADQIKMPDVENSLSIPVLDMENSAAFYDVGMVGESSFISDFTPSDFDAFDTEQHEVDPLSEADVYLAYGRYQQAEDLIRHAIKQEPEKDIYKLKLLEIFYAGENRQGFTDYVQELAAKGKQADRIFWGKVTEMAQEIVADLPLFAGGVYSSSLAVAESNYTSDPAISGLDNHFDTLQFDVGDLDFPIPDISESMDELLSESSMQDMVDNKYEVSSMPVVEDNSLEFDASTDFNDTHSLQFESKQSQSIDEIESFEFDLSDLALNDKVESSVLKNNDDLDDSLESFDFNFELDSPNSISDQAISGNVLELQQQSLKIEDDFFTDHDLFKEDSVVLRNNAERVDTGNLADFQFDFDMPVIESKEYSGYQLGVAELTDVDEFSTKIDLAKAYIDMGDNETAKVIAEEVLTKGNEQQQGIAKALLDDIKQ